MKNKNTEKMISPVRCSFCGEVYDLTKGKVIHRYADCTLYKTPCCNKLADDREWKSMPDFSRITNKEIFVDVDGTPLFI